MSVCNYVWMNEWTDRWMNRMYGVVIENKTFPLWFFLSHVFMVLIIPPYASPPNGKNNKRLYQYHAQLHAKL